MYAELDHTLRRVIHAALGLLGLIAGTVLARVAVGFHDWHGALVASVLAAAAFLFAALNFIDLRNVRRRRTQDSRRRHGRCEKCGYNLRGAANAICPECERRSGERSV